MNKVHDRHRMDYPFSEVGSHYVSWNEERERDKSKDLQDTAIETHPNKAPVTGQNGQETSYRQHYSERIAKQPKAALTQARAWKSPESQAQQTLAIASSSRNNSTQKDRKTQETSQEQSRISAAVEEIHLLSRESVVGQADLALLRDEPRRDEDISSRGENRRGYVVVLLDINASVFKVHKVSDRLDSLTIEALEQIVHNMSTPSRA